MKIFWLNDGMHISGENEEERLALEIFVTALQSGDLAPAPTPKIGALEAGTEAEMRAKLAE